MIIAGYLKLINYFYRIGYNLLFQIRSFIKNNCCCFVVGKSFVQSVIMFWFLVSTCTYSCPKCILCNLQNPTDIPC